MLPQTLGHPEEGSAEPAHSRSCSLSAEEARPVWCGPSVRNTAFRPRPPPPTPPRGRAHPIGCGRVRLKTEGHGALGIVCQLPCASECLCRPAAPRSRSVRPAVPRAEGLPCRSGDSPRERGDPPRHFPRRLPMGKLTHPKPHRSSVGRLRREGKRACLTPKPVFLILLYGIHSFIHLFIQ